MNKPKLYLIPGFLTDKTIYKNFLDDERLDCEVLEFITTNSAVETIEEYAKRLSNKIDSSRPFSLLGTSFGGILAIEISKFVEPQSIIFVSSVKNYDEMNPLMHFEKSSALLDYIPSKLVKRAIETGYDLGIKVVPTLKQIDNKEISEMIHSINGRLEKWIIKKINTWKGENKIENFLHLHGDKDNVFPIKNIKNYELIKGGNHNMIISRSEEIIEKVVEFLEDKPK
jgi:esterase/lipase